MIHFTKGNIITSSAEALVNTVNTVGVMGKGVALQFKEEFPKNLLKYKEACNSGELTPGELLITRELNSNGEEKIIISSTSPQNSTGETLLNTNTSQKVLKNSTKPSASLTLRA